MPISDKNRKIIWGKSGSRCAICKAHIVMEPIETDKESVVGDECHIVSKKSGGPRYRENYPVGEHDFPNNIILLCKTHHKQVDDQSETFSESLLKEIKQNHETWVNEKLSDTEKPKPTKIVRIKENIPNHLRRIESGKELLAIALNSMAGSFDYDDIDTDELVDFIAGFYQNIQDYIDIGIDEVGQRIQIEREFTNNIKELNDHGLWLFGAREQQRLEGGIGPSTSWPVVHLRIISKQNDSIIEYGNKNS